MGTGIDTLVFSEVRGSVEKMDVWFPVPEKGIQESKYHGSGPENWLLNYRRERHCSSRIKPPTGKAAGAASPDLQLG